MRKRGLTRSQKQIERQSLIVSAVVNFIMAAAGIAMFVITKLQAMSLDGFFSLIAFISTIVALLISSKSKKRTRNYPKGIYFLEPLYAVMKSIFTILLLVISTATSSIVAYNYFAFGVGEVMNTGPVVPYCLIMVALCFGLSFFNKYQNKRINNMSSMLLAESKSNLIDGLVSGGVAFGVFLLYFIRIDGPLGFLHYTGDFFITIILVAISVKEPVSVLVNAFRELSGATMKDNDVKKEIMEVIDKKFEGVIEYKSCRIYKMGMFIKIHVELEPIQKVGLLKQIYKIKNEILEELSKKYEHIEMSYQL